MNTSPLKICHINLATGFSGGERQTLALIKQQLSEGKILKVIANPKSPFAKEVSKLDCELIYCTHFIKNHSASITKDCSLVHVHEGRAIYWALIQKLLYNIPYIVTRRIDNKLKNKWLSVQAYKNASVLVGLSNEIVHRIQERHPDQNIKKIPSSPVTYPVDEKRVEELGNKLDNKFIIIQAGNMLTHKGFDTTIRTARLLREETGIHFALLGSGPEEENLKKQAEGLSNVTFFGKSSEMGNWFRTADLIIHPSYTEGLGSVLLEAINAGLPAIGSNAGGIPDIIDHGVSGLLVPPGDADALADAIRSLHRDPSQREQLIKGGKEKMKQFAISYTSRLYDEIYAEIERGTKHTI